MLAKKFTNADIITQLHNFAEIPEFKIKHGNQLIRGLSFIPLSAVSKYRKFTNYPDLLQVGYETLWKSIMSFDVSKSNNFFCWSYMWIRQKIAKEALKEKNYLSTYVLAGLEIEGEESHDFEESIFKTEERHLINSSLLELSKVQHTLILDIYDNGRSLREIGKNMKLSHESVRKMKEDATSLLKKIVERKLIINI